MLIKYKGKDIDLPDDFILKCGAHAESRGMTLEEYIAEAFTMLENTMDSASDWSYDANGSPIEKNVKG